MAEAQLANAFFANDQGTPYFRKEEACDLSEDMGMVYIKQEDDDSSPPESVLVPSMSSLCTSELVAPTNTCSTRSTHQPEAGVANPNREATQKFQDTYLSKDRKIKFHQYLRSDKVEVVDGCYSGTILAIYDESILIKFRIDTPAEAGLPAWPVTDYYDEAVDGCKGRKYLTRQYDIDEVLEAFHLWSPPEEDEAVADDTTVEEENEAAETHHGCDLIEEMKSVDTFKTEEASDFLTKIAKSLDTKDLAGILARCFDASAGKEDVKSSEPAHEEQKQATPSEVKTMTEEPKLLTPKAEAELPLNEKQSQFVKFPLHCPVTFKGLKPAAVQGVSYNMADTIYRYNIKLNGSGFYLETNETNLAFAPLCSVLYKGEPALIVSASKCRKEYSIKCNGQEAIDVAISEDDLKFDPSSHASSVKKDEAPMKLVVKSDTDASVTSTVVEKKSAPKPTNSSTKQKQVKHSSPKKVAKKAAASPAKGKRKLDSPCPSPSKKRKADSFYEPIIHRGENGIVIEMPAMRKGLSFKKLAALS